MRLIRVAILALVAAFVVGGASSAADRRRDAAASPEEARPALGRGGDAGSAGQGNGVLPRLRSHQGSRPPRSGRAQRRHLPAQGLRLPGQLGALQRQRRVLPRARREGVRPLRPDRARPRLHLRRRRERRAARQVVDGEGPGAQGAFALVQGRPRSRELPGLRARRLHRHRPLRRQRSRRPRAALAPRETASSASTSSGWRREAARRTCTRLPTSTRSTPSSTARIPTRSTRSSASSTSPTRGTRCRSVTGAPGGTWVSPPTRAQGTFPFNFVHSVYVDGKVAFVSYWDFGTVMLDVRDPSDPKFLGRTEFVAGQEGNAHSAWTARGGDILIQADEDFDPTPNPPSRPAGATATSTTSRTRPTRSSSRP